MADVKMFYRHSENVIKIEKKNVFKPSLSQPQVKNLKWSSMCLQDLIFQLNASKTSLWCLQIINVLKMSSTGLENIWSCNFTVKYWIRLEHGFKYATLQRTSWRLVHVQGIYLSWKWAYWVTSLCSTMWGFKYVFKIALYIYIYFERNLSCL